MWQRAVLSLNSLALSIGSAVSFGATKRKRRSFLYVNFGLSTRVEMLPGLPHAIFARLLRQDGGTIRAMTLTRSWQVYEHVYHSNACPERMKFASRMMARGGARATSTRELEASTRACRRAKTKTAAARQYGLRTARATA